MKEIAPTQLAVGMTALMKVGSPVRQWMHNLRGGKRKWLVPVQYTPPSQDGSTPLDGRQYVEVNIAKLMPPYAIVYHHNGHGWVKLWLDTREATLFDARP
jgi:hypothetical protein